jgi:hypothetical protein
MTEERQFCPKGHDTFQAGRDSSYRCLACKREASAAARAARETEELEAQAAEIRRRNAEAARRSEREYRRAIAAGGDAAAEARWDKLFSQTLDETGGRFQLCQWPLKNDHPGACTNRTGDVFCAKHNRELEREQERLRKAQDREDRASVPVRPSAPGVRRRPMGPRCLTPMCGESVVPNGSRCAKHNTSGWAAYKTKHPGRAAFYASSTWRSMRERQLRDYPACVVCGERASQADHVVSIALGGSLDGRLQSMCAKHHHEKTVRDSHEAAKRAAARRKEKQR